MAAEWLYFEVLAFADPPMINVPNSIIIHIEIDKTEREDFFKMFFLFIFLPPEFIFESFLMAHLAL